MNYAIAPAMILLMLAGCGNPVRSLPEDLQSKKPACAGGDFDTCAEIGHAVRDASGGVTQQPKTYIISQPIVD
ncbi:hypothetical protein ACFORG_18785 [Lutimaribacter marinistellae]|uniref:Lipoprotein n=1 Tax=Lutimaribacter marinistellae TaxID=1820329 RepID=A0ABV7TKH8_9RHOB